MADNNQFSSLFYKVVELHDKGISGDDKAVQEAHEQLKKLRKESPNDPLVEAYYGSTMALLGRNEIQSPIVRMEYAEKGLKILDRVVHKNPNSTEIRSLRAFVCFKLPEQIFGRTITAIEDFNYIINEYESNPGSLKDSFYYQILYDLGLAYETVNQLNEAKTIWKKLLMKCKDTKYIKLLQEKGLEV